MKKKQTVLTIINGQGKFVAPNRKTAQKLELLKQKDLADVSIPADKKFDYVRLVQVPVTNTTGAEFASFRKELALKHGSKTGKLKKKHLNREKQNV